MKFYILFFVLLTSFLSAQSILVNEIMSSNSSVIKDEDNDYPDWLELYNSADTTINLNLYSLSDDISNPTKWIFPNIEIASKEYLLVFASGKDRKSEILHTNFKIKSSGEHIWLRDSTGKIIDEVDSIKIPSDISYGRNIKNLSEWLFYEKSTPGNPNTTIGYLAFSEPPQFSLDGGFYTGEQQISFQNTKNIYYTLDGSEPQTNSSLYSSPIVIDTTTVIRARRIQTGFLPSKIVTQTFIINESFSLPVVSLSTDPKNLWDDSLGIYTVGTNGIKGRCGDIGNYNQDWERPVHIEFYETNGILGFGIDAGVKIHGGCTRKFEQKSLAIIARNKYGIGSIPYKIFPNREFNEYKSIILRMSGNDHYHTFIKDAVLQSLVEPLSLEHQAYRPCIVFLNGKYWGIYNIRERISKEYLAHYQNLDPENIDLLKGKYTAVKGDSKHYKNMYSFFKNHDISIDSNYSYVSNLMDIENYISYMISEMYFVNVDWFPYNRRFFRPKTANGRWRWILFDTDLGFSLADTTRYKMNMINYVTDTSKYPSVIIRGLLNNEKFKRKFINTFADYYNTIFRNKVLIHNTDSIKSMIVNEMPKHSSRWKYPTIYWWNIFIERLKLFGTKRLEAMRDNFIDNFNLNDMMTLNLNINNPNAGAIHVNTFDVTNFPWSGKYFSNIPVKLKAKSKSGYKFLYWKDNDSIVTENTDLEINVSSNKTISAVFKRIEDFSENVVINEINYDSSPSFDTEDWIELYNNTENDIDISNWVLRDKKDKDKFIFPQNTIITKKDYLVICRDTVAFVKYFTKENYLLRNYMGDFNFGLSSKGEMVRLTNASGEMIDSLIYDDVSPWPIEPKGNGKTLELLNPILDNTKAKNWGTSNNHGSPGKQNDSYIIVGIRNEKDRNLKSCILKQNYPNPFNPTTVVRYSILNSNNELFVSLKIYDVLGREVATLVNKPQKSGYYEVNFDGKNLTSGVYYYRLKAGSFVETKKMVLLR